jgi:hypothetical protein
MDSLSGRLPLSPVATAGGGLAKSSTRERTYTPYTSLFAGILDTKMLPTIPLVRERQLDRTSSFGQIFG